MCKNNIGVDFLNKALVIGAIAILVIAASMFYAGNNKQTNEPHGQANLSDNQTSYFSDDASVMYFYSDYCSHCVDEKVVLKQLGAEGYKVRSVRVQDPDDYPLFEQYNVTGTPTFIAQNGDKLRGYQDYNTLKNFLDTHK